MCLLVNVCVCALGGGGGERMGLRLCECVNVWMCECVNV